ncbi:MAG TPA: hypothetical protein VIK69_00750 [Methylophilaceae bacterium]
MVGQPVWVEFDGITHMGVVERIDHGWARCSILIDPLADYGVITERMSVPQSTVMVRTTKLKPRETEQ